MKRYRALFIIALVLGLFFVFRQWKGSRRNIASDKTKNSTEFAQAKKIDSTSFSSNKEESLPIQPLKKEKIPAITNGQNVIFSVGGILKKGEIAWKKGTSFKFNDFICKIDETALFKKIAAEKVQYLDDSKSFLSFLATNLPETSAKWEQFFGKIDAAARVPKEPEFENVTEKIKYQELKLDVALSRIIDLEKQIENYYFIAPFDGTIVQIKKQLESKVKKSEIVVVIQKDDE
ncbi:MAG: hypothetical protein V4638_03645 [Bacteroidota bacterium]